MRFLGMLARATLKVLGLVVLIVFAVICITGALEFVWERSQ